MQLGIKSKKGGFWTGVLSFVAVVLRAILPEISENVRQALITWLTELETQAQKTANVWDDIFVDFLKSLFGAG